MVVCIGGIEILAAPVTAAAQAEAHGARRRGRRGTRDQVGDGARGGVPCDPRGQVRDCAAGELRGDPAAALPSRPASRPTRPSAGTARSAGSVATPAAALPSRHASRPTRPSAGMRDDAAGGLWRMLPCKPRDWRRLTSLLFLDNNSRCLTRKGSDP